MKKLDQLTKKERRAYIDTHGVRNLGKLDEAATSVQFMIENNTPEEIADFLQHQATTTFFPGTPADWFVSVYEFNRLHDYCKERGTL